MIREGILSQVAGRCAIMPSITKLQDGSFIACHNVGSGTCSSDHVIEVLKTSELGQPWRNLGSILRSDDAVGWSYRGADIRELPDRRLVMTASRFEAKPGDLFDPDSEGLARPEMVLLWSSDRGETWSSPEIVPVDLPPEKYTCNNAGRLIQFSPSRWMFPFETWKPESYAGQPDQKAAAVFSSDQGKTWGEYTVIADDPSGRCTWWDQANTRLADGRVYVLLWTHLYGTNEDLPIHWVASSDEGRTWTEPRPTNLRGQVSCPMGLPDGSVAVVYNFRHDPQGVRVAVSRDLETFDLEHEVVVFDAQAEATLGRPDHENFLAEHQLIGFGKPQGDVLDDGSLLVCFWCTVAGVTHTRWVQLQV